jgi:hypothetical protein
VSKIKASLFRCLTLSVVSLFVLFAAVGCISAQTVSVSFTVEPYFMIELTTPSITFSSVSPGESVEQSLEALVKSNVPWNLRVEGTSTAKRADGTIVEVNSCLYVMREAEIWENISALVSDVIVNHPPTDSSGVRVSIPLKLEGDFRDPPGTYTTEIKVTLVPQV